MTVNLQSDQITPQDLRNAAQLVEHAGLAKGDYVDGNGACCAVGAIGVAKYGYDTIDLRNGTSIPCLTDDALALFEGGNGWIHAWLEELVDFNDLPDTTLEMVADRLVQLADQMEGVE